MCSPVDLELFEAHQYYYRCETTLPVIVGCKGSVPLALDSEIQELFRCIVRYQLFHVLVLFLEGHNDMDQIFFRSVQCTWQHPLKKTTVNIYSNKILVNSSYFHSIPYTISIFFSHIYVRIFFGIQIAISIGNTSGIITAKK